VPRRHRKDYPGAWWHVGNRGVDRTEIFREDADYEQFTTLLAAAAQRGWIELHAWSLLPNHFHLLVRSPRGDLAQAMQWIQHEHALWFNERHGLSGHRFESRYWGKLILSLTYRRIVFGYVHRNPRAAGLEADGSPWTWPSERDYEADQGRPWLTRTFGLRLPTSLRTGAAVPDGLFEGWQADPQVDLRELDELLRAGVARVRSWLARSSSTRRFLCRPGTLLEVLQAGQREAPWASTRAGRRTVSSWELLLPGLLRSLCGYTLRRIAEALEVSPGTAGERVQRHHRALREDEAYALQAAAAVQGALRRDYAGLGA
jgi:REP element-mobilizing transposase RayT